MESINPFKHISAPFCCVCYCVHVTAMTMLERLMKLFHIAKYY